PGDSEYGISRGRLLPDHRIFTFDDVSAETRQKLQDAAAAQGVKLRPAIEIEGREAMREVVASGAGIGFVSMAEFGHDARLIQVTLKDVDIQMSETLVCMKQRGEVRAIRAFMRFAANE
ncbi:MAG: LysR family transcriptional regulator substrate-binding protein, partial [Rhodobacteraceae bacterium]|nr:LysR family transcriptional regulator substrate-binding protein [Paracoccaceae bacterium]